MQGKDVSGCWDGYSWMPFYMGTKFYASFSHHHDFDPAPKNHAVPQYGIFARLYYSCITKSNESQAAKYTALNCGGPHFRYNMELDALEHQEILQAKGIAPEEVRHPAAQARLDAVEKIETA